jgi:hypothetical protein
MRAKVVEKPQVKLKIPVFHRADKASSTNNNMIAPEKPESDSKINVTIDGSINKIKTDLQVAKSQYKSKKSRIQAGISYLDKLNINDRILKGKCIDEELYDSYPVDLKLSYLFRDAFSMGQYCKRKGFSLTDTYKEMIQKLPCTCHTYKSYILNGLPKEYFNPTFQFYSNCPRVMACCARRVLNQHNIADNNFANSFFEWFLEHKAPLLEKAIKTSFKVNLDDWFLDLKNRRKQFEVLRFMTHKDDMNYVTCRYRSVYVAFVKGETQRFGEKPRQIGNPSNVSKFVGMPANKPIEHILKQVYGDAFGLGRSYQERADILNKYYKTHYSATLDISGMDQSHNDAIKQPWYWFIDTIIRLKGDEISKWTTPELFRNEYCKSFSTVSYDTIIDKKFTHLFTIYIKDKMVSGSAYTSVLNTFLMMNLCEYAGFLVGAKFMPHSSGDDVCVMIPNYVEDETARKAFYQVFSWPKFYAPHGSGLYLKYCVISHNPYDMKPCSTEIFICRKCGIRVVRPLYKLFYNYFLSHKFLAMQDKLSIRDYRRIVFEGDMAWAKGLTIAELFLRTIGKISSDNLAVIADRVAQAVSTSPKIMERQGSSSFDIAQCQQFVYDLHMGDRVSRNCPECDAGYKRMILYKYGLTLSLAYKICASIVSRPMIGAIHLRRLEEIYQRYDEENCKPPSDFICAKVHKGYLKDKKIQYLRIRPCYYRPIYKRKPNIIIGLDHGYFNQYLKELKNMARKYLEEHPEDKDLQFYKDNIAYYREDFEIGNHLSFEADHHDKFDDQLELLKRLGIHAVRYTEIKKSSYLLEKLAQLFH